MRPDSPTKNMSDATAVLPAFVVQINSVKRLCHPMNHRGRHIGRPMVVWLEHKLLMWVGLCCSCGQITKALFEQEPAQNTVVYCLSPYNFSINALPITAESDSSPGCPQTGSEIDNTNCSQHLTNPLESAILLSCKVKDKT